MTTLARDFSRRSFVKAVLAGTAGTALVPLLSDDWARAQGAPRRVILMSKTNGMHLPGLFPATPSGGEIALSEIASPPPLLSSMSRRFKDLVLLGGIEQTTMKELPSPNGHHSASHTFTGAAGTTINSGGVARFDGGGISLDQWLAQQIGKTVNLPYPTLNLSVNGGGDKISWRARDQGVTNEDNPYTVFTRLFGARNLPPAQVDQQRAERKSVLDFVSARFAAASKTLGTEDRAKLDFHGQSVRDLEKRLTAVFSQAGCTTPMLAQSNPMLAAQDQMPARISAQIELIVGAMACDLTRVATLKIGGFGDHALLWLGDEFKRLCTPGTCSAGKPTSYHDVSHQQFKPDWTPLKQRADQFFLEAMMLYALDKLDAVKEGAGTMLDSTLVVLADDMGNGSSHAQSDIPWILGGRIGGRLKTNRFVHQGKRSHNGVLVAIAHMMGYPVDTFGDAKFGGLLPGLLG